MRRPPLQDKEIFNPEEAAAFTALYGKRKLIIRGIFETYITAHPEIKEELKSGKLSKKT